MFVATVDKLVSEFQRRLGSRVSVPWGWFFTKLAALLSRYPTGVTKAIMFAELESSWRKIEKLQAKGTMHAADSLQNIVLSKYLSPQAVFEVCLKEVKNVEGTRTRIAVLEEHESSSRESGVNFTMEMYLHQKLYGEVDKLMTHRHKLRFSGCRLFQGRTKKLRLLPSESFVVLVNEEAVVGFCQNFASLEGLDVVNEPQYIKNIIKVKVTEIAQKETIHHQNGHTANRVTVLVSDDVGIQAKLLLWEEYLVMVNLFEEGDTLYIKQCFLVPDKIECFSLEYGPDTIIYCQPLTHEQEILPSQKDGSKKLYVSKNNKGMLDCSTYPERIRISDIRQNMTNIVLFGKVVFVGIKKLQRGEGVDKIKYDIRVQEESGVCNVLVVEPYRGATVLHCGQFVLMKNLHVSTGYSIGTTLGLNTDKDGELWNLSSLQGWLATSSLCTISSLNFLKPENSESCVIKGIISHVQARSRDECVVRVHCSCQGHVVEGMVGQLVCEKCEAKGMVEIPLNKAPKLFTLDGFWCWQYSLSITIMESEEHHLNTNITNVVGEKLLQMPARHFQTLGNDARRRVLECTLGQECLSGLTIFKAEEPLVSAVNQI